VTEVTECEFCENCRFSTGMGFTFVFCRRFPPPRDVKSDVAFPYLSGCLRVAHKGWCAEYEKERGE
jgi:hypothetical protein